MKDVCPRCAADYFEVWPDGSAHCFGCGWHHGEHGYFYGVKVEGAKRPVILDNVRPLSSRDYKRLKKSWGIAPGQADLYGLAIAEADGCEWLYLPVVVGNREVHFQLRAWDDQCRVKYRMQTAPPPGLVWASWWSDVLLASHVAIVEGILDGIRVAEVVPTIATFGTALTDERAAAIQQRVCLTTRFLVCYDGDALDKAVAAVKQLGMVRSVVVPFEGDPADLSTEQLAEKLAPFMEGENVTQGAAR